MTAHDDAAKRADDLIGAIWQRQLEIARDEIEERTETSFDDLEEVKRSIHLFHDLDDTPAEFRELEDLAGQLDAAYHALRGDDLAGDEERFSEDITPDDDAVERFMDRLDDVEKSALLDLEDDAVEALEDALDALRS